MFIRLLGTKFNDNINMHPFILKIAVCFENCMSEYCVSDNRKLEIVIHGKQLFIRTQTCV